MSALGDAIKDYAGMVYFSEHKFEVDGIEYLHPDSSFEGPMYVRCIVDIIPDVYPRCLFNEKRGQDCGHGSRMNCTVEVDEELWLKHGDLYSTRGIPVHDE